MTIQQIIKEVEDQIQQAQRYHSQGEIEMPDLLIIRSALQLPLTLARIEQLRAEDSKEKLAEIPEFLKSMFGALIGSKIDKPGAIAGPGEAIDS